MNVLAQFAGALAVLGGLGLLFGAGLAIAARAFAVETDPLADRIRGLLPEANCGGCGFAGCEAYAKALAAGEAAMDLCPVGGRAQIVAIAEVLGKEAVDLKPSAARVLCAGSSDNCAWKYEYQGPRTCSAAAAIASGPKACRFACIGFGDCVAACKFGAMRIENDLVVVDEQKCVSCGACVRTCPKDILKVMPLDSVPIVRCRSLDRLRAVSGVCKVGCIACGLCVKACRFDAIHLIDDLAVIDYEKCTQCMACSEACPTNSIDPLGRSIQREKSA